VCFGIVGLDGDRLTVRGDGLCALPFVRQGNAEIVVDFGVVGLEDNGLPVGGDGLLELPLISEGLAKIACALPAS